MKLEDLVATTPVEKELEAEFVEDNDEGDDDDESDLEQDLTDALSLLEDCSCLLGAILAFKEGRKLTTYMFGEIERLSQESEVFLAQYDGSGAVDSTDWNK